MNTDIKALWVAALKSGDYRQGKHKLKSATGEFDCLGVLCDLHAKATGKSWVMLSRDGGVYEGQQTILPAIVQLWAGLTSSKIVLQYKARVQSLISLNDIGIPFVQLAQLIDDQL